MPTPTERPLDQLNDAELIQRTLQGQREAFDNIALRYLGVMHAIALAALFDPDAAHDLVQEALIRAFLNLDQLQEPAKVGPWLAQITRHLARDWQKAGRRRSAIVQLVPLEDMENQLADPRQKGARHKMETQQTRSCLLEAIQNLDPDERELVLLYYTEDLSKAEIARQTGLHRATVGRRLDKAFARMRTELEPVLREEGRKLRPSKKFQNRTLLILSAAAALSAETKSAIAAASGTTAVTQATAALATLTTGATFAADTAVKGSILMTMKAKIIALITAIGLLGGGVAYKEMSAPKVSAPSTPSEQTVKQTAAPQKPVTPTTSTLMTRLRQDDPYFDLWSDYLASIQHYKIHYIQKDPYKFNNLTTEWIVNFDNSTGRFHANKRYIFMQNTPDALRSRIEDQVCAFDGKWYWENINWNTSYSTFEENRVYGVWYSITYKDYMNIFTPFHLASRLPADVPFDFSKTKSEYSDETGLTTLTYALSDERMSAELTYLLDLRDGVRLYETKLHAAIKGRRVLAYHYTNSDFVKNSEGVWYPQQTRMKEYGPAGELENETFFTVLNFQTGVDFTEDVFRPLMYPGHRMTEQDSTLYNVTQSSIDAYNSESTGQVLSNVEDMELADLRRRYRELIAFETDVRIQFAQLKNLLEEIVIFRADCTDLNAVKALMLEADIESRHLFREKNKHDEVVELIKTLYGDTDQEMPDEVAEILSYAYLMQGYHSKETDRKIAAYKQAIYADRGEMQHAAQAIQSIRQLLDHREYDLLLKGLIDDSSNISSSVLSYILLEYAYNKRALCYAEEIRFKDYENALKEIETLQALMDEDHRNSLKGLILEHTDGIAVDQMYKQTRENYSAGGMHSGMSTYTMYTCVDHASPDGKTQILDEPRPVTEKRVSFYVNKMRQSYGAEIHQKNLINRDRMNLAHIRERIYDGRYEQLIYDEEGNPEKGVVLLPEQSELALMPVDPYVVRSCIPISVTDPLLGWENWISVYKLISNANDTWVDPEKHTVEGYECTKIAVRYPTPGDARDQTFVIMWLADKMHYALVKYQRYNPVMGERMPAPPDLPTENFGMNDLVTFYEKTEIPGRMCVIRGYRNIGNNGWWLPAEVIQYPLRKVPNLSPISKVFQEETKNVLKANLMSEHTKHFTNCYLAGMYITRINDVHNILPASEEAITASLFEENPSYPIENRVAEKYPEGIVGEVRGTLSNVAEDNMDAAYPTRGVLYFYSQDSLRSRCIRTDGQQFHARLHPGRYRVRYFQKKYHPEKRSRTNAEPVECTIVADEVTELDIKVTWPIKVSGRVVKADTGEPWEGATFMIDGQRQRVYGVLGAGPSRFANLNSGWESRIDSKGNFEMMLSPGRNYFHYLGVADRGSFFSFGWLELESGQDCTNVEIEVFNNGFARFKSAPVPFGNNTQQRNNNPSPQPSNPF